MMMNETQPTSSIDDECKHALKAESCTMVGFISPIKPNVKVAAAPKIGNISNEEDASTQPSLGLSFKGKGDPLPFVIPEKTAIQIPPIPQRQQSATSDRTSSLANVVQRSYPHFGDSKS
jgi:hypothetical protein